MTKKKDEVAEMANASEETKEESSTEPKEGEQENLDESKKEANIEKVVESKEEVSSDYLGDETKEKEENWQKRYGDSTREYQTLRKKTDSLSLAMENLEKLSKANPKIVSEIEAAQKGFTGDGQANSTLIKQQISEALEPVKKITQDLQDKDRREKTKVLSMFEKKHPTLFSLKATKEEKTAVRQRIGKVANALVETGMGFKQAVNRAYLTVNPKAAIQKGKDEAYLEGLGEKQAGFSSQVSAVGKKSGKSKYTKRELEVAKKFGDKYYKSMVKKTK